MINWGGWGDKSLAFILTPIEQDARINILEGAVRSAKTVTMIPKWLEYIYHGSAGLLVMTGVAKDTVEDNVLNDLFDTIGARNYSYNHRTGLLQVFWIDEGGSRRIRRIKVIGAKDKGSEKYIRGKTIAGAYCDELSLMPESFFKQLLNRLSVKGAKLYGTTNPDHPSHYLYRDYIKCEEKLHAGIVRVWHFTIDDNPNLDSEYKSFIKSAYSGFFYDRFILGLWVAAQGRIYKNFSREKHVITAGQLSECLKNAPLTYCNMGVDYGGNGSATVFNLVGLDCGMQAVYVLAEHYDNQNLSAEHVINDFVLSALRWKEQYPMLCEAFCDSAEQFMVKSFRAAVHGIDVRNARKDAILQRIYLADLLMTQGRLFILDTCPHLIESFENAVWNDKNRQKDERLDDGTVNIDSLDAFEYSIERYYKDLLKL